MKLSIVIALVLLTTCTSCLAQENTASKKHPTIELPPELDRVLRDYETGWQANDEDALAALFTSDGFILRPGHEPVRGRDAIRTAYANSGGPLSLRALSYGVADTVAFIIGAYGPSPDSPDSGKFTLTLRKRAEGRWFIASDMDNGNRR